MSKIRPSTQLMTEDPEGKAATVRNRAIAALPGLLALEGATRPRTPEQVNDAITTLAKAQTAVIRLLLDQLDTTSGT